MDIKRYSSPGMAPDYSGRGARDGPSLHRVRWWRPRTIRAKAGIAALAAAGATGLVLALGVGLAGAPAKPVWSMTAGNVQQLSETDPAAASHFFNTPASYGVGASLVTTPVRTGYATTPVLSYTSYAEFASEMRGGAITYPYKWVMYDPEDWSATPVSERRNPVRYMTLFGRLAHANGLKVIQAPALDLADVPGSVFPRRRGESADQWFIRVNIAGAAAAAGDIFQLQDESNTTAGGQYAYMFNTTQGQARAANGNVQVFSEVSTVNGTAAQMATAVQSISPDGVYVAAAGNMAQAVQFFQLMKTAGY
ncbi:MAG: hypothetical protein ACLP5E_03850 [Streptosporangiaceae bacterium]